MGLMPQFEIDIVLGTFAGVVATSCPPQIMPMKAAMVRGNDAAIPFDVATRTRWAMSHKPSEPIA